MDFGLRDWLLIIGPLFIAAVLLHGYWRMRANRNKIKMALDKSFLNSPEEKEADDLDLLRAELPSGGARVIKKPEQNNLDLDEDVPVLMEPVDVGEEPPAHHAETDAEPDSAEPGTEQPVAPRKPRGDRPEKFLVMHVLSREGKFRGQNLLETLVDLDMRFGEMDIFHRIDDASGEAQFSLANAVEPGTFDLSTMDQMMTPGVTLFMKVHELDDPLDVYNDMLHVADTMSEELGGEVRDQSRSVLTPQTIEHCKQDIKDYQLKHA